MKCDVSCMHGQVECSQATQACRSISSSTVHGFATDYPHRRNPECEHPALHSLSLFVPDPSLFLHTITFHSPSLQPSDGLQTTPKDDIRRAGIGGMSSVLGWTDVQREEKSGLLPGGFSSIAKIVSVTSAHTLLPVLVFPLDLPSP